MRPTEVRENIAQAILSECAEPYLGPCARCRNAARIARGPTHDPLGPATQLDPEERWEQIVEVLGRTPAEDEHMEDLLWEAILQLDRYADGLANRLDRLTTET